MVRWETWGWGVRLLLNSRILLLAGGTGLALPSVQARLGPLHAIDPSDGFLVARGWVMILCFLCVAAVIARLSEENWLDHRTSPEERMLAWVAALLLATVLPATGCWIGGAIATGGNLSKSLLAHEGALWFSFLPFRAFAITGAGLVLLRLPAKAGTRLFAIAFLWFLPAATGLSWWTWPPGGRTSNGFDATAAGAALLVGLGMLLLARSPRGGAPA